VVELLLAKQTVVGSIPILRSINALVVQLAEAPVLETGCCKFESYRGHHNSMSRIASDLRVSHYVDRLFSGELGVRHLT
jgi:hypothetical protein